MPRKPLTIPKLVKKLDRLFSLYVRHYHSPDGEHCECVTCGKWEPIKDMDAGHLASRAFGPTRHSESNVFPQCRYCNRYREGMKPQFVKHVQLWIGEDAYEEMLAESVKPWKWERGWLEERITYYQGELKAMGVKY